MKKILAILLTAILFVVATAGAVAALPSPESEGIISGVDPGYIILEKIDEPVVDKIQDVVDDLKKEEDDDTLKVVDWYDVIVVGDPEFDVTVTLDVLGITPSSKVFILLENEDDVVVIKPIVKDGKIIFDLPEGIDRLAIVTDGKTATDLGIEDAPNSPQTGDITPFAVALMAIMGLAGVLVSKKVKA